MKKRNNQILCDVYDETFQNFKWDYFHPKPDDIFLQTAAEEARSHGKEEIADLIDHFQVWFEIWIKTKKISFKLIYIAQFL